MMDYYDNSSVLFYISYRYVIIIDHTAMYTVHITYEKSSLEGH